VAKILLAGNDHSMIQSRCRGADIHGGDTRFLRDRSFQYRRGSGETENARYATSVQYRTNLGAFQLAALYQFGGYSQATARTAPLKPNSGATSEASRSTRSSARSRTQYRCRIMPIINTGP
jgi:hypothetical protein